MSENETSGNVQEAPAEARRRHADLSLEITEADHRYYILDSPTISDIDYDTKMRELRALEGSSRSCALRTRPPRPCTATCPPSSPPSSTWSGCSAWTTSSPMRTSAAGP